MHKSLHEAMECHFKMNLSYVQLSQQTEHTGIVIIYWGRFTKKVETVQFAK